MDSQGIPGIDPRLTQGLGHPIRVAFLRLLAKRKALSASQAAKAMGGRSQVALSQVSYHALVLERIGLIEATDSLNRDRELPFRIADAGELLVLALDSALKKGRGG
jgi:DNA-binding transcriptional ArsR family regulator